MIAIESVLKHVPTYRGSYIGGEWVRPAKVSAQWEMISPANIDWVLPPIAVAFDHVELAIEAGARAFATWKETPLPERISLVNRFGEELTKRAEQLARVMAVETGKTLDECVAEANLLPAKIKVTIEEGLDLIRDRGFDVPGQGRCQIRFRPKGIAAVIGPFNFPVHLSNGLIVPALLSGNVCILKPSEKAPYSAQIYVEAAEAAGLPKGVLQLVQGNAETATRLVRHPGVNAVLATCSLEVGVKIQKECAERPEKIVVLEMGGKNAGLVWTGAKIQDTAEALIRSAYLSTGQRCTALSRVYVERSMLPELMAKVHELAKALVIHHPFEDGPKPFMGPLISAEAKEKFLRYSAIAETEKAEAIMRPKPLEGAGRVSRRPVPIGHYVSPSIHHVAKWNAKSAYQNHELFGPDLFFCPVDSIEEGLAAMNSSPYGLVASVFGATEREFDRLADSIECGLVYWNRPTVGASARLPFGGWKGSGNHRPAGLFAILNVTQVQSRILGS